MAVVVLLGLIGLSLIPKDEELARRAAARLTEFSGVPVSVGALHWRVLPVPSVVLQKVVTQQSRPIELKQVTMYFELGALLQRRVKLDRVLLEGATVPQLSLRALAKTVGANPAPRTQRFAVDELPLARFEFRDVTWLTRRGLALGYEGEIDFDASWRPRTGQLRRPGLNPAADLSITREGQEDRWATRIHLADGTANGELRLQTRTNGRLHLDGTLKPEGIDAARAVIAFNRRAVLAGKASGVTTLSADGHGQGAACQSDHQGRGNGLSGVGSGGCALDDQRPGQCREGQRARRRGCRRRRRHRRVARHRYRHRCADWRHAGQHFRRQTKPQT